MNETFKKDLNPNSHGVGHIGHALLEGKLLHKTLTIKILKN